MKSSLLPLLLRRLTLALTATALGLALAPQVLAQANSNPPERLTYQGFLVDANGTALANSAPRNYDVIFRIYDRQSAGTLAWAEQQTVTVDKGYFSVLLGEGSQAGSEPRPSLSAVFAGPEASDRYVGVTVKGMGTGGTDLNILPRLRLLTSPYAFLARQATALVSPNGSNLVTAADGALTVAGTVSGTSFAGSGAGLTGLTSDQIPTLSATKITSGTLSDARLSSNIPNLDASQTFTGNQTVVGKVTATSFAGYGIVPVGTIVMWSGTTAPTGWALCTGQTVNGVTTPDLRGRFVLSSGSGSGLTPRTVGQADGKETHTLTTAEMPSHSHTFRSNGASVTMLGGASGDLADSDDSGGFANISPLLSATGVQSTGGGAAHNNMPPYHVLAFIMRVY
ncbi:MAG: tail fiber protein [Limisphaerales bacterium]